jgi:hypothetical protein
LLVVQVSVVVASFGFWQTGQRRLIAKEGIISSRRGAPFQLSSKKLRARCFFLCLVRSGKAVPFLGTTGTASPRAPPRSRGVMAR